MRWRACSILTVALYVLTLMRAEAEDSSAAKKSTEPGLPLFEFIKSHPTCMSFTDNCVICSRNGTELNCSTEGIACEPLPPKCTSPTVPTK